MKLRRQYCLRTPARKHLLRRVTAAARETARCGSAPGCGRRGAGAHDGPGRARRWALTMAVLRRNPVARYPESGDARGCGRVESPVSAASSCTHPRWSAPGSRTGAQRPEPDGLARPNDLVRRHRPACVHRTGARPPGAASPPRRRRAQARCWAPPPSGHAPHGRAPAPHRSPATGGGAGARARGGGGATAHQRRGVRPLSSGSAPACTGRRRRRRCTPPAPW